MFSFHIGLPGLHEDILCSGALPGEDADEAMLVSREDYATYLDPFVRTRDKAKAQKNGL
jgi:hypothetical protein